MYVLELFFYFLEESGGFEGLGEFIVFGERGFFGSRYLFGVE